MSPIKPDRFKKPPEDILDDLVVLKAGEKDADFLPCLWHYWDQWKPDNGDVDPFLGEATKSRRELEKRFGDRRFAEQIKDFHDVLLAAKMRKIDLNNLTTGEKRALQEGVEIVLPGLYAEEARYAKRGGQKTDETIGSRKKLEAGQTPAEGSTEALKLKILGVLNPEGDPISHLRKHTQFSAQRSSAAEQEMMFLKDACKLTLELCDSLGIRIKESTQNFVYSNDIAR